MSIENEFKKRLIKELMNGNSQVSLKVYGAFEELVSKVLDDFIEENKDVENYNSSDDYLEMDALSEDLTEDFIDSVMKFIKES